MPLAQPSLAKREPVAVITSIAVLLVTAASLAGVVLDLDTVDTFITDGVFIVSAFLARRKVTPNSKL